MPSRLSLAAIYAIILANGFGLTDTGHGPIRDVLCLYPISNKVELSPTWRL